MQDTGKIDGAEYNTNYKWSTAATKGLLLSLVTLAATTIAQLPYFFGKTLTFINVIFWFVQIACSIYLLFRFMKEFNGRTGQKAFGFGVITCLFSSLICAIFDTAGYLWFFPSIKESLSLMIDSISQVITDDAQIDMLLKMQDNYAQWLFISSMIKDIIIGIIASAIISSSLERKKDIFQNNGTQNEEDL